MTTQSQMSTASLVSAEKRSETAIDLLLLVGLALMGYGLWLFKPWVAFAVVGAVMVLIAVAAAFLKNRGSQRVTNAQ